MIKIEQPSSSININKNKSKSEIDRKLIDKENAKHGSHFEEMLAGFQRDLYNRSPTASFRNKYLIILCYWDRPRRFKSK